MNKDIFSKLSLVSLLLISFVIFFANLGNAPIELWDEQTNVEVVNDTLASGDNLTLTRDSKEFFEKPPFWYYFNQLIVTILGNNIYVYRLTSAVSGVIVSLSIYSLLKDHYGLTPSLIGTLSFLAVGQNVITNVSGYFSSHTYRSADLDALHIALIMLAFVAVSRLKSSSKYLHISALFLGLAIMAKGPFALLPGLILIAYIYKHRTVYNFTSRTYVKAAIVFLSIVLPWHVYMQISYGAQFTNSYLGYHVFQRALTTIEQHYEWRFFYFEVFTNSRVNSIWLVSTLSMIILLKKKRDLLFIGAFVITATTMLVLTIVETKLAWYLLTIYPFISIIVGIAAFEVLKVKSAYLKYSFLSLTLVSILFGLILNLDYVLSV